jgi:hypothetical protein
MKRRSAPYLSMRLAYPLPIKGGAVLLTLQDARDHVVALGPQRATPNHWKRAYELIGVQVDVEVVTNQFHRAMSIDDSLDLEAFEHLKQARCLGSTGRRRWRV